MIRKGIRLFGTALAMSAIFSMASFAATAISSVNFAYTIDSESSITEGYNEPMIELPSGAPYEVGDISCTTESITGKTAISYTMTLSANYGYYFPASTSVAVSGNGITEVVKSTTSSSDNTIFTVKFKAFPYYQLSAPSFVTAFDDVKGSKAKNTTEGRGTSVTIEKNGASKIEYVINYVDQDGEVKTKSGTTTGSTISVSTYNKQYTGTSSSKQSCYIRGIAIRAAGNSGSNTNVVPSKWVFIDGGLSKFDTEEYFKTYSSWDDLGTASTVSSNTSYTANTAVTSTQSNVNVFGWQGSGDTWYYYSNGQKVTGWLFDGTQWYYCDPSTGLMRTGWIQDSGRWYYLNTAHDGFFGCMKTGWITDNGATYYLNPVSDGTKGAMFTGTHTIDGKNYNFAMNGALIG